LPPPAVLPRAGLIRRRLVPCRLRLGPVPPLPSGFAIHTLIVSGLRAGRDRATVAKDIAQSGGAKSRAPVTFGTSARRPAGMVEPS
jgi:hypothetical protein